MGGSLPGGALAMITIIWLAAYPHFHGGAG
jgi:hypothetical protein